MKRIKLELARQRLRNLTYAELRGPAGGYVNQEETPTPEPMMSDTCLHNETLCQQYGSNTITHQRSYQLINTIC
jgi:hypothetical protein